jgi:hypothetical protein
MSTEGPVTGPCSQLDESASCCGTSSTSLAQQLETLVAVHSRAWLNDEVLCQTVPLVTATNVL